MTNSDNGPVDARTVVSQLDATDGVILDMLEKDGRATLSHLSEATGLSVSAVQSRVQKLERRGVIRGYKAVIDDERRGLAVNAYIAVTPIDYSQEAEIPDKLKNIDGIMSCDSVAGSPSFMLTVRVESPSKLEELLNLIHRTVSVSTDWVTSHIKDPKVRVVESDEDLLLYDIGHVPGAHLIPLGELPARLGEIASRKHETVVTICRSGARSARAAAMPSPADTSSRATLPNSSAMFGAAVPGGGQLAKRLRMNQATKAGITPTMNMPSIRLVRLAWCRASSVTRPIIE